MKVSEKIFEKTDTGYMGVYVVDYYEAFVCKVGVSSDVNQRMEALKTSNWEKFRLADFVFPLKAKASTGQSDDYNALRTSSFSLERLVHEKLKELDLHIRGEFFEITAKDASAVIRKVADQNGFKLATPYQILGADYDLDNALPQDRMTFFEMANAAGVVAEYYKKQAQSIDINQ